MTDTTDSRALEHEVEAARTRLATTIDRLASPETADATKEEIKAYAQTAKDEIATYVTAKVDEATSYLTKAKDEAIESARETAQQKVQSFTEDLKERARANPAAVGLIGAGIAWRLYKHPPVTTLLVGAGIALLMNGPARTRRSVRADPYDPDRPTSYVPGGVAGQGYSTGGGGVAQQVRHAVSRAGDVAQDLGSRAGHLASEAASRVSHAAGEAGVRAAEFADEVRARAGDAVSGLAGRASEAGSEGAAMGSEAAARASEAARQAGSRASDAAVRASASLNTARREAVSSASYLVQRGRGNPYVIGGVGLACGLAIWRAIQETESGSRFMDRTSRSVRRAAYRASTAASSATRQTGARAGEFASTARSALGETITGTLDAVRGAPSKARSALGRTSTSSTGAPRPAAASHRSAPPPTPSARRRGPDSAVRSWFNDEVLAMPQRYPFLLAAIGLSLGAAAGGSMRLTRAERDALGPLSRGVKKRVFEAADEGYDEVVRSAREAAEQVKSRLKPEPKDLSSDFETVLGGGPPPVDQQREGTGAPGAGGPGRSNPAGGSTPGGASLG